MRNVLIAAALGFGLWATPAAAGAMPASNGLAVPTSGGLQSVDWRPYYHCHPRRGFCHGGRRWHRGWDRGPRWRHHRYWRGHHWRGHRHWR